MNPRTASQYGKQNLWLRRVTGNGGSIAHLGRIRFSPPRVPSSDLVVGLRPWVIAAWAMVVVIATVQRGFPPYAYPVFPIFRASSWHLLAGQDLYAAYNQGDLFKYSPTFALLFTPLAALPFAGGLLLWNALNAVMLWHAVTRLLPPRQATIALALLTPELLVATQASQSNALVASLIILAFVGIERDWSLAPATAIALGALTKIFPLAALSFGVFAHSRRRFSLLFACSLGALVFLPLVAISPASLLAQYRSWGALEAKDLLARGESVMGLVACCVRGKWSNWPVQAVGTAILLVPLAISRRAWSDLNFRRVFLCSLLGYVVLFNPQAERQSYIIATTGLVVWYVAGPRGITRTVILALALTGAKVVLLVIAAWLLMQRDLLGLVRQPAADAEAAPSTLTSGSPLRSTARLTSALKSYWIGGRHREQPRTQRTDLTDEIASGARDEVG